MFFNNWANNCLAPPPPSAHHCEAVSACVHWKAEIAGKRQSPIFSSSFQGSQASGWWLAKLKRRYLKGLAVTLSREQSFAWILLTCLCLQQQPASWLFSQIFFSRWWQSERLTWAVIRSVFVSRWFIDVLRYRRMLSRSMRGYLAQHKQSERGHMFLDGSQEAVTAQSSAHLRLQTCWGGLLCNRLWELMLHLNVIYVELSNYSYETTQMWTL